MKSYNGVSLLSLVVLLCGAFFLSSSAAGAENDRVQDILFAQPFQLGQSYTHTWRKEQPSVSSGYLIVLAVDPEFIRPRQVAEPVLYVGEQTAERVNAADVSGRLVVIVPSPLNGRGEVSLDLTKALLWFGTPELPERIDAAQLAAESNLAARKGIKPFSESQVRGALRRGGDKLRLPDRQALERRAAGLIQEYSPNETDLIRGLTLTNK